MPRRTPLQAYQHVLAALDAGTVNPTVMAYRCAYEEKIDRKVLNCGVGSLFNRDQLDDLHDRKLNSDGIRSVAKVIGWKNLLEVTGLNDDQLFNLQEAHDSGDTREFRDYVKARIKELTKA